MRKRAYHHGNLRTALIDAGLRAIAADGPDNFSLRDVARRAGVSPAAVYRHFADKDALLGAIAVDCSVRIRVVMDEAIAAVPPDPLLRFRAKGVAYVRFAVRHPHHFRAMTTPGIAARMPAELARAEKQRHEAEVAELAAAQREGMIAPLPLEQLLLAAGSIAHGLAMLIVQGELGDVDEPRAAELASQVTAALGVGLLPRLPADPFAKPAAAHARAAENARTRRAPAATPHAPAATRATRAKR